MKKRSKEILDLLGRRENDHTISKISMTTSKNKRSNRSVLEVTA